MCQFISSSFFVFAFVLCLPSILSVQCTRKVCQSLSALQHWGCGTLVFTCTGTLGMWYSGFYLHLNTGDVLQWFLSASEHWGCGAVVFTCTGTLGMVQWCLPALELWGCNTVVFTCTWKLGVWYRGFYRCGCCQTCVLMPDAHLLLFGDSKINHITACTWILGMW